MDKAAQREAARRIMAKLGPMTEEEEKVYEMLVKRPEEYVPPDPGGEWRRCAVCGKEFRTKVVEGKEVTAMQQFSDHQAEHNPSPNQWSEAHKRIGRKNSGQDQ